MTNHIHIFEVTKSTGGVGAYVRWLAQGLDKTRFRLTVACLSEGGPALAAELNALPGVRAFSLHMNRYKIDPLSDAKVGAQLAHRIRNEHFDVLHAHASKPGFLARLAAAGSHVPVVYSPHCFAFHPGVPRLRSTMFAGLERLAARYLTSRIIAVCEEERTFALAQGVGRSDQVTTVYAGVVPAAFDARVDRAALRAALHVPLDAPLVGAIGRLSPQKAPLDFVRAAALVHAQRPDAHFVWVGDGPLAEAAHALVEAQDLAAVFHFAGQRNDVPALLQALDCFVLPSRWEGFSLAALEAMAARLPVVATQVMGASEAVVEGLTGLLVAPGAPAALAHALLDLLSDPERARRFGAQGRQRVERMFTREQMIKDITKVYDEVYASAAKKSSYIQSVT